MLRNMICIIYYVGKLLPIDTTAALTVLFFSHIYQLRVFFACNTSHNVKR